MYSQHVVCAIRRLSKNSNLQPNLKFMRVWNRGARDERTFGHNSAKIQEHIIIHTTYPTGVKVSKPFAADHGKPFFFTASCMFRPVISIAKAIIRII